MDEPAVLVADVGGTNTRIALASASSSAVTLHAERTIATGGVNRFGDALAGYLEERGRPALSGCAVCGAGPIERDADGCSISLTNAKLRITEKELRSATGLRDCRVLNDFSALALSLPVLRDDDLRHLGGPRQESSGGTRAVVGPGTGLGMSGLIPTAGGAAVIEGEGGHADLAACSPLEAQVLAALRARAGHVSAEQVLSGPGLEHLYLGVAEALGRSREPASGADIARRAWSGEDEVAAEAMSLFTQWLGRVAGNLALTLGARAGVYLAGGILPAWGDRFDARVFRQGFEDKGGFRPYMERIPTWLVTHPHPALLGLARQVLTVRPE